MTQIALALLGGAVLLAATNSHAQYVNGEAASSVLGQPNFANTFGTNPPNAASQNAPCGVAVDPVSGAVFVSDRNNSRILRYESATALQSGAAAIGVLGQSTFSSLTQNTTQSGLRSPGGIWVDFNGRLWVADTGNNRVVWFNNAAAKANGANADGVIGQTNFTNQGSAVTSTGMNGPSAVVVAQDGSLWVADTGNNRVLRFSGAAALSSGAAAVRVLGQSTFNTNSTGSGSTGMNQPAGVASDLNMTLWVSDSFNNRILGFPNADSIASGAAATRVLGQPDLNTTTDGTTATKLSRPEGLLVDLGRNTLYVADRVNNRVLAYLDIATKANGSAADRVLGAASFTDSFGGSTAAKLQNPFAIAIDENDQLFIADRQNNRTLRYPPVSVPQLTGTGAIRVKPKKKKNLVYTLRCTNYPGSYRITFPKSGRNFAVSAKLNGAGFSSGGSTITMPVNTAATLSITLKGKRAAKKPIKFSVTATAIQPPSRSATVTSSVKVK